MTPELPFVDEHTLRIEAPRERVWPVLERYAEKALTTPDRGLLATLLGTEPRSGFAVASSVPGERLELAGRHRFSRYELVFELTDAGDGTATRLHGLTYAVFPGLHGRLYRALVIGTRLHVVATRRMMGAVARIATR